MSFNLVGMGSNKSLEPKGETSADLNISLDLTWFFDAPNQPHPLTKAMVEDLAPAGGKGPGGSSGRAGQETGTARR